MARTVHRTVSDILDEARGLTHAAHRAVVDRLPDPLRHLAGYHIGWWEADRSPRDSPGVRSGSGGSSGGKAIRPALTLACAAVVGGPEAVPDAVPAAIAVEVVHDFSLLHDDVMDQDTIRRGRPAAWTVFGADQALLAGDALLAVALAQVTGRAQAVLCDTVLEMCGGQSLDLRPGPDRGLAERLVVAEGKTGALFGAACELGALAASSTDSTHLTDSTDSTDAAWCRAFGRNLGTAFQLADDLTDGWPGPQADRDRGRGEARRRIAAALSHLDAAAGSAAEDLRLLTSAVLAEPNRKRRISGAHTAGTHRGNRVKETGS
jgi:geranylgeranyl diphosphate synthase type I